MNLPSYKHERHLRTGRFSEGNRAYMVTTSTYRRQPVFADFHCGRLIVQTLQQLSPSATTFCFVIMPDHIHWLFQLTDGAELSRVMKCAKSVSARRVKQHTRLAGPLWQKGFYDRTVRAEDDLKEMARYIVANPVRAGLVRSVREYPLWDAIWLE